MKKGAEEETLGAFVSCSFVSTQKLLFSAFFFFFFFTDAVVLAKPSNHTFMNEIVSVTP